MTITNVGLSCCMDYHFFADELFIISIRLLAETRNNTYRRKANINLLQIAFQFIYQFYSLDNRTGLVPSHLCPMWTVISVDLEVAWWWHISMSVSVSVLGCLCPCPCFHTLVHVYVHVGAYVYVNSIHPIFLSISNPSWYYPTVPLRTVACHWPVEVAQQHNTTCFTSTSLACLTHWLNDRREDENSLGYPASGPATQD
jgi:hypothetical protein